MKLAFTSAFPMRRWLMQMMQLALKIASMMQMMNYDSSCERTDIEVTIDYCFSQRFSCLSQTLQLVVR